MSTSTLLNAARLLSEARAFGERSVYRLRGQRPRSPGYTAFKHHAIEQALAGPFQPDALPPGWGWRLDERIVEYPWLFARLPRGPARLLDAGSVLNFGFLLEHEALAGKAIVIQTLEPEPDCFWHKRVSYVYGDLRQTCFRDAAFDTIVCVSTLEHVGMDNTLYYSPDASRREDAPETYRDVVREMRRLLAPGGRLYLTVPFGRRASHGWLQVFDAGMIDTVIETFAPSEYLEHHFRYEPDGWTVSTRERSSDATYSDYFRTGAYDADFQVGARAVACLELKA